jgi:hypothetical protein
MNPLIAYLAAQQAPQHAPASPLPAPAPNAAHQRATAYDREYIAAHAHHFHTHPSLVAYDRTPLPQEWHELLPSGAFVRVFVINERTTVRVLHTATEQRIGEPVIDTWCGEADASSAS